MTTTVSSDTNTTVTSDKHDGWYLLNYLEDPFAYEALKYYAFKCAKTDPALAQKIWLMLKREETNE